MKFWERAFEQHVAGAPVSAAYELDRESFRVGFNAGRAWVTEDNLGLGEFTEEEATAVRDHKRLFAFKLVRDRLGCHLREAKRMIDARWPL